MITKNNILILILALFFAFIYGMYKESSLNNKSKDKPNKKANAFGFFNISSLILLLLLIPSYIWIFPNVLVFESCNKIQKYILINPFKNQDGISFDYGNNISYVINETNENLEIVQLEYGNSNNSDENTKQIISANTAEKFEIAKFDFINQIVPKHIRTKSSKRTYYYIGCESSNEINSILVE